MSNKNNSFYFSYSGASNDELQHFKEKYTQTATNHKLQEIRRLDKRVDFISTMISIVLGLTGTVLLAHAVIFLLQNPDNLFSGSAAAVTGTVIISTVPIIHNKITDQIKKLMSPRILALIKEIEQNQI